MRPIKRGPVPQGSDGENKVYTQYGQAKDDLKNSIGHFCSYCEMNICNQSDIEHVQPKSSNEVLINSWSNFLLACKSCNIIKSDNNDDRDGYVFPDEHNTSFLFEYNESGISVKDDLPEEVKTLALATFNLVSLNRKKDTAGRTDDRAFARLKSWQKAQVSLNDFLELPNEPAMVRQTARSCDGFFSMWLQVFSQYPEVKRLILEEVKGSAMECYDAQVKPIERLER
ncbi:HNH endonuclease domain-containing protein [Psychromonas sp. Urea-02u-13]|uniref:HNH endonuclease domain-containing protein n=1 Tax=Psychromonas sp. Urea-02u-13 TaxID=2058326 RepID=UPI000C33A5F0|nr:HNH endonuclease domain-containing protein [Psychromonas sp. Urea-02u-13]PKG40366.1 hypothetical protein CXF74_03390 [Psychromonas sp. Urea-02u-13]